ncbi:hypothetical protein NA56DRAFT_713479 [Hyaloscypha hepaticicola]|uniref:Uncharacterized protein n=1 Tax=Hyaloscypha hepaticicola TaxID=2082293 RepID=A0A2J6PDM5_9HELO|nr:hypothetical protein NA56DRAFT_713479 [Hyaloscypha hepaticicola]
MCIGVTSICSICGGGKYSIHPDLRCDEAQPFPAWHVVRGPVYRNRQCESCVRSEQEAMREEGALIAQHTARAIAVKQYLRGERPTPFTDEACRERENERARHLWAEYLANRRLHPFTVESIAHTIEMIRVETGPFLHNPVIATIPQRFAECVRRQEEVDGTGREITLDDWDHS